MDLTRLDTVHVHVLQKGLTLSTPAQQNVFKVESSSVIYVPLSHQANIPLSKALWGTGV